MKNAVIIESYLTNVRHVFVIYHKINTILSMS